MLEAFSFLYFVGDYFYNKIFPVSLHNLPLIIVKLYEILFVTFKKLIMY